MIAHSGIDCVRPGKVAIGLAYPRKVPALPRERLPGTQCKKRPWSSVSRLITNKLIKAILLSDKECYT